MSLVDDINCYNEIIIIVKIIKITYFLAPHPGSHSFYQFLIPK